MNNFKYFAPESLEEAIELLKNANNDTYILNGGTDIVVALNRGEISPKIIVNIRRLKELDFIKEDNGNIRIGALATFTEIEKLKLINEKAKVLALACKSIGSTQIRNMGTIAGNIVTASPSADSVPALIALNAKAVLKSINGIKEIYVSDIFEGANKVKINKSEILTEIYFKALNSFTFTGFRKLGRRASLAVSRISIAVVMEKYPKENKWKNVSISLGAVAENPFKVKEAENILKDKEISKENIEKCVEKISEITSIKLGSRASAPFKRESVKGVAREVLINIYNKVNS